LRTLLATLLLLLRPHAAPAQQRPPLRQSFDLQIPWRPSPVNVAGKRQLVYELQLTNCATSELSIRRIEVLDAAAGSILGAFEGAALNDLLGTSPRQPSPGQTSPGQTDKRAISPGVRATAYLSVPSAPALKHRIEYVQAGAPQHHIVEGAAFTVQDQPLLLLGPPLHGGPWVAIYNASWERGHRRVPYAVNGAVHIPGRFAIDWIKLDDQGNYAKPDPTKLANWYGYSAEVLAVADAVVVAATDNIAEPSSVSAGAGTKLPLENASGNYVVLDLGQSRYAFYEHLKPGSIRVNAGDRMRRGQTIALLGYTGESTGPHLHFHVANAKDPLDAEGIPYALDSFELLGAFPSIEAFGKGRPWPPSPSGTEPTRRSEFPAPLAVVQFP
jgi:murein DD-endopeptidase